MVSLGNPFLESLGFSLQFDDPEDNVALGVGSSGIARGGAAAPSVPASVLVLLPPTTLSPRPQRVPDAAPRLTRAAGIHPDIEGPIRAFDHSNYTTTTYPPNQASTTRPPLSSFSRDPGVPAAHASMHGDTGVHFRHLGRIVGSLHFGHIRFDSRPTDVVANFT